MRPKTSESKTEESAARTPALLKSSSLEQAPVAQGVEGFLSSLQRARGNRFVQRLLSSGLAQAKLTVSKPSDPMEQEADRVAEQVMRMPDSQLSSGVCEACDSEGQTSVHRMCTDCEEELQRQPLEDEEPLGSSELSEVESHISTLDGSGEALPETVRDFFEPRFGRDFSSVRVHTNTTAGESALALNARAFTLGHHIVFGDGEYQPQSDAGRRLLAHELTHVVQQGAAGSGVQPKRLAGEKGLKSEADVGAQHSTEPVLQRACGVPGIGTPGGCTAATDDPAGELILFNIECDEFVNPVDAAARIHAFADSMQATDTVNVHGFASTDGDATFNDNLSCARANRVAAELGTHGIQPGQINILKHGATAGPAATRRSVVLELAAGVSRPVVPQLTGTVSVGPTAGVCGAMNFVIQWSLSRNSSAANGGFIIQDITFTWDVRDCTGTSVPNPDPRTSPLNYFEAWRVLPGTTTITPVTTDTFFWPGASPWAGGCTDGEVDITATAQYHDDVAALPAHMVTPNAATFAGGLQSSLTDPALGGNVSRPVPHRLRFHWTCCPCSSSPTVVDDQVP